MTPSDSRIPLSAGTVLRCGEDRYTLGEVLRFGGSSVLYAAEKEGSRLPFAVKECFPAELSGSLSRSCGMLCGTGEEAEAALMQARERMVEEAFISQEVARTSRRILPVLEVPSEISLESAAGVASAPSGSFLILQQVSVGGLFLPELLAECSLPPEEGHPLRTGGLPGLSTAARILKETLRAVELVHASGYIHGDIHPGNLYFVDAQPERGELGYAALLDFGCARKPGIPVGGSLLFTTPGFTAPEIAQITDGTLCLTAGADVYSAGRLLLCLLKGRTFYENGRDRLLSEGPVLASILPHEARRLGCTPETLRLLRLLLDRSLALRPEDRYPTVSEMLSEAEQLVKLTASPPNRLALSVSALAEGEFQGREDKLGEIRRALQQRQRPVILWGFAGMGKTELAIEFGRRYEQTNLGQVSFVRFRDSVRQTVTGPIADAFSGYSRLDSAGRTKPEEQVYREVLKLLGQRGENALLIVDNMDTSEDSFDTLRSEPAFRDLCAIPAGLLITTRSRVEDGIEVDALPPEVLCRLMQRICPELTREEAAPLIQLTEGHTLTAELMARTLKHCVPRLTPAALLERLRSGELELGLPGVSTAKDRDYRKQKIRGHLTALFRLADLPESQRLLMGYALPISSLGLKADTFARAPGFDPDVLLSLTEKGWLRRSEDDTLTLHPLVREIGWRELSPDPEKLCAFACGVAASIDLNLGTSAEHMLQLLNYFRWLAPRLEGRELRLAAGHCLRSLYRDLGYDSEACRSIRDPLDEVLSQSVTRSSVDAAFLCALRSYLESLEKLNRPGSNSFGQLAEYGPAFRLLRRLYAVSDDRSLPHLSRYESGEAAYSPPCFEALLQDYSVWLERASAGAVRGELLPVDSDIAGVFLESAWIRHHACVAEEESACMSLLSATVARRAEKQDRQAMEQAELGRRYCLQHGLDTTNFEVLLYRCAVSVGDDPEAWSVAHRIARNLSRGVQAYPILLRILLDAARYALRSGRPEEAKPLFRLAAEQAGTMPRDRQQQFLLQEGESVLSTCLQQGWLPEAAAWHAALEGIGYEDLYYRIHEHPSAVLLPDRRAIPYAQWSELKRFSLPKSASEHAPVFHDFDGHTDSQKELERMLHILDTEPSL